MCDHDFGGADGIVARSLKKTVEKPLNSSVNCHLPIFPLSLRNPLRSFGHRYNAPFWQQLATVVVEPISRRPASAQLRAIEQGRVNFAPRAFNKQLSLLKKSGQRQELVLRRDALRRSLILPRDLNRRKTILSWNSHGMLRSGDSF
jgi:hypothetical protein